MSPARRLWLTLPMVLALAGCAAAPLRLYTLSAPAAASAVVPATHGAPVIEVARINMPDYLDTQDIVVRRGSMLERSETGRWVTRLSLLATNLITARLAMRRPDAWVTDEEVAGPPDYRIIIDVSKLDVMASGTAILAASWQVIPRDAPRDIVRDRTRITLSGSVATDRRVVRLERRLLDGLAASINIRDLRKGSAAPQSGSW